MRADEIETFVASLDLDVGRVGICHACLSFVSFPLDDGDLREARRQARAIAPYLWDEGLAEHALAAVRHASEIGDARAGVALGELERGGCRSAVARAIVLRLAADLTERTRRELALEAAARPALGLAAPEWN
ncbi:MAG: hypothetical protein ACYDCH_05985 [Gaiellaceae bacterium]